MSYLMPLYTVGVVTHDKFMREVDSVEVDARAPGEDTPELRAAVFSMVEKETRKAGAWRGAVAGVLTIEKVQP